MSKLAVNPTQLNAAGVLFFALSSRRNFFLMRADQKSRGQWGLPGGKVEAGETLIETLERECREEIGIWPEFTKLAPIQKFTAPRNHFAYHTFFCVIESEFQPTLNHEHIGYAWIDAGTMPTPLHPGFKSTIKIDVIGNKIKSLTNALVG